MFGNAYCIPTRKKALLDGTKNSILDFAIDYRCDDEKKTRVGATSWYHCLAEDSRISKMPVINPLQALVHPQTQKTILHGLSIPNLNFSEFDFFW
jgi:hypothetical protein